MTVGMLLRRHTVLTYFGLAFTNFWVGCLFAAARSSIEERHTGRRTAGLLRDDGHEDAADGAVILGLGARIRHHGP